MDDSSPPAAPPPPSSNPPVPPITKRLWRMVRIVFFMIRKGIISKSKLMLDLRHLMSKRGGKLAGKAIGNLMFFHHHHHDGGAHHLSAAPPKEYEFSCSNSPASFFTRNRRRNYQLNCPQPTNNYYFSPMRPSTDDDAATIATMQKILEMLNSEAATAASSPAVTGLGRTASTPLVRQLRITDSPFPLRNDDEDDGRVDQQAEMFIERFYEQLKQQQRSMALELGARH